MCSKVANSETFLDETRKIWSGKKLKLRFDRDSAIGKLALASLLKEPDHISQICYQNQRQYTNRDIATLAIRVAQHFKKIGIQQTEVIGVNAANSDYLAPLFFGAMLAGLTVSTLDPSFDKDGIKHIFSVTKPKIMFCDGSVFNLVREALTEIELHIPIYTVKDHVNGVLEISEFLQATGEENSYEPEPLKLGFNQTAAILCSSGTTGLPKGVCMSHVGLLSFDVFNMSSDDKYLCFSTLYWVSGLMSLICGTITGATRVISEKAFAVDDLFNIIEKYKITCMLTPPSQLAMAVASPIITNYDLSSLAVYLCGGSAVSPLLIEKMKPFMPNCEFYVGYGMSEVCAAITYGVALPNGATGKIANNVDIKIINPNGDLLGTNERGEICIRMPFPWSGYYGNVAETNAIYKDGWVHSGDVGYINEEGYLFVIDRIKDILKYNNFHFYPTEIENVILEMPGVDEVCVCGIPDPVSTYLPAAAIVRSPNTNVTEMEVYAYVADKMAFFKHLRGGVYFLDKLPKTASGKNLRRTISNICEQLQSNIKNGNINECVLEARKQATL